MPKKKKRCTLKEQGRALLKQPKVPLIYSLSSEIEKLVRYYSDGWRVGTLMAIKDNVAKIQPLVGKYATEQHPHCLRISIKDIEKLDEYSD